MEAFEHGNMILGAILPNRVDLMERAVLRVQLEYFQDRYQKLLWQFLVEYYERTSLIAPISVLDDQIRKHSVPDGHATALHTLWETCAEMSVVDAEMDWSIDQLIDIQASTRTAQVFAKAVEIYRSGLTQPNGERLQGHAAAREYVLTELDAIEAATDPQSTPEGLLQDDAVTFMGAYLAGKQGRLLNGPPGIQFGIPNLDFHLGGLIPGELVLLLGYTSDGKTGMAVQVSWSAAVEQGKNVAFFTSETVREQINRRLLARHSKLPMFGLPDGLNSAALRKYELLEPVEEDALRAVLDDLSTNPNYGRLYVAQVPRGATLSQIEQKMYRLQSKMHIDLVVIDYLGILRATIPRGVYREDATDILKDAKQLATTFNHGRGVTLLSPWQVTRTAREQAERLGAYTLASLADTSEASKTPDTIVSLLGPMDNDNRYVELTVQILKRRDGETVNGLMVHADRATSFFSERGSAARSRSATTAPVVPGSSLDSIFPGGGLQ